MEFVYIRVRQARILPIPTPPPAANPLPAGPPPAGPPLTGPPPADHLYLIEGRLEDVMRYAGQTVDWLIRVAHLICEPLGAGRLYTHPTGTASDWYHLDRTPIWHQVNPGDLLLPGIYEFELTGLLLLSKISERDLHSVTTAGAQSSSTMFRELLHLRDGSQCVVTEAVTSLIASHLIPKRLGSDGARDVVTRFSGAQAALGIYSFAPKIGILLWSPLDTLVDHFHLGFYHEMGDTYTLHNFHPTIRTLSVLGSQPIPILTAPPLHLHSVTLSVHGGDIPVPAPGVFDWHYLQCVIGMFGTPQYKNVPNIRFFVYPFKTADDLNDESMDDEYMDNNGIEPPHPTYNFDKYRRQLGERQMALERDEAVARWSSGVQSG
ncbi:hypothetical protein BS47DRAFT_1348462 [Hydnum rufescens UP504]|uniref:Uncharacterized protein n=1 Tax=Hydnum rufescens UP504 TaxID=1448309 RepID=A0A9P6AQX9_9AGAM|nr:hypothetical protein BS47DRAFT_1348462 [Hydnum rufescens UP504]